MCFVTHPHTPTPTHTHTHTYTQAMELREQSGMQVSAKMEFRLFSAAFLGDFDAASVALQEMRTQGKGPDSFTINVLLRWV